MIQANDLNRNQFVENSLAAVVNDDFIAGKMLTPKSVAIDSGEFAGLGDEHLRTYKTERATYDRSRHEMDSKVLKVGEYRIKYHDLSNYVPDQIIEQAKARKSPIRPLVDMGKQLLQTLELRKEIDLADTLTDISIMTNYLAIASDDDRFDDYVNSNPEKTFEFARSAIQSKIGVEANSVMIPRNVLRTLKSHPFFLGLVHGIKILSDEQIIGVIKDYFGIENVYVGRAIKRTSKLGQPATNGYVWGKDMFFYYKGTGDFEPNLGYNLSLDGYNRRATVRREPNANKGELVEVSTAYQDLPFFTDAGFLLKNVIK